MLQRGVHGPTPSARTESVRSVARCPKLSPDWLRRIDTLLAKGAVNNDVGRQPSESATIGLARSQDRWSGRQHDARESALAHFAGRLSPPCKWAHSVATQRFR